MASESKPNPIKIDFTPNSFSNMGTIGILPPPRLGMGAIPKVSKSNQKNPKKSKRIQKILKIFHKILKIFHKIPKDSKRFQKIPKESKRVKKIQKNSKELISKQYFTLKEPATAQKANGSPSSGRIKD